MRRLGPRSLVGQIAILMGIALLVAQAINFTLILTERQRLSLAQIEGPAIARFVNVTLQIAGAGPGERAELLDQRQRRGRFAVADESAIPAAPAGREPRIEARLRQVAAENGLVLHDVRAMVSHDLAGFFREMRGERAARRGGGSEAGRRPGMVGWPEDRAREIQLLLLSARLEDGSWINARLVTPRRDPWLVPRLAAATLLLYIIVLGAMVWIAARLARPLRALAIAAERFGGPSDAPYVEPAGPADLKRAIHAFNAINGRVAAMLDEKDRMLGAIGHDLRTPLASLRIRAEAMEPEEERGRVIATIEEMTALLDDTLELARSGRAREPARRMDLCALVDTVVEEYRELGHDVTMASEAREVAAIRPNMLRRAVRNLIDNAVKYGGAAEVALRMAGDRLVIEVMDRGPGIAEAELGAVQEPFYRLEGSRNRGTGGTGLGLAIARAAAQSHGGELELSNRPEGGLAARILLPRA